MATPFPYTASQPGTHQNIVDMAINGVGCRATARITAGWPLYESCLKGKRHVINKRHTQRTEWHNLNLRQQRARLGRKSQSFSIAVERHDKVTGHYLNIKHYQ